MKQTGWIQTFKNYQLLWAMLIGVILYPILSNMGYLMPWLLFILLTLNYTKISPKSLAPSWVHLLLLVLTLICGTAAYLALNKVDHLLAIGALLIFLTPTATAAGVITNFLGGNISFVTCYLFLGNILCALAVPVMVFVGGFDREANAVETFFSVISQVALMVMGPLAIVWVLRYFFPRLHSKVEHASKYSILVWSFSLAIIAATTIRFFFEHQEMSGFFISSSLAVALVICLFCFAVGRWIGKRYVGNAVTVGQSFAQKNTVLAIWIATTYIHPLASLIPAAYVFWQNIVNAIQLAQHRKREQNKI